MNLVKKSNHPTYRSSLAVERCAALGEQIMTSLTFHSFILMNLVKQTNHPTCRSSLEGERCVALGEQKRAVQQCWQAQSLRGGLWRGVAEVQEQHHHLHV